MDPGPGQEAWKLDWLSLSTVRKKCVPSTCWLAAQSFPFPLPEVPVFFLGGSKLAKNNKPDETIGPSPCYLWKSLGKIKPRVETGSGAICRLNVQGGHQAGLLLGLDASQNTEGKHLTQVVDIYSRRKQAEEASESGSTVRPG